MQIVRGPFGENGDYDNDARPYTLYYVYRLTAGWVSSECYTYKQETALKLSVASPRLAVYRRELHAYVPSQISVEILN